MWKNGGTDVKVNEAQNTIEMAADSSQSCVFSVV